MQASPNSKPLLGKVQHREKIDGCALITKQEVEAIQVTSIIDTKSSEGLSGNFLVSQCYYSSDEPNKSVSLAVTQANPNKATDRIQPSIGKRHSVFPATIKGEEAKDKKERAEEDKGIKGRDATVARRRKKASSEKDRRHRRGSVLGWRPPAVPRVLKDVFIRISVGGPDNEETKTASRRRWRKALQRL
jgi:hypothetical protein